MKSSSTFSAHKCDATYNGPVVKVAAGTLMQDLYKHADLDNRTVVGGTGGTVSAGGYITGGGHSILSAKYGLAADQVVEMEMVTPMGEILVLNECHNTDLFWAMRGVRYIPCQILASLSPRDIQLTKGIRVAARPLVL